MESFVHNLPLLLGKKTGRRLKKAVQKLMRADWRLLVGVKEVPACRASHFLNRRKSSAATPIVLPSQQPAGRSDVDCAFLAGTNLELRTQASQVKQFLHGLRGDE